MYPDFKELLSVFNAHSVKYLVVGAYAVSRYAQPRATKDIDILIQPDAENAQLVYAALKEFGAPLEALSPADFSDRGSFFRMGREPIAVDILTEIPGVDFGVAWAHRVEDVIAAKLAAGRPQDIADVAAIRKAAKSRMPQAAKKKRLPKPPKSGPEL